MKLHILAIAAHPDDIELGCGGTLIKHAQAGQAVGIVDLTQGELGTRGSVALRFEEAEAAARTMGVTVRENARMADGFFRNDEEHQRLLIPYIRHYQPDIVIANALSDRHPDHGRGGRLIADACFLAGLQKIKTEWHGVAQSAWRPRRVYHMIQDRALEPTFIVDITDTFEQKDGGYKMLFQPVLQPCIGRTDDLHFHRRLPRSDRLPRCAVGQAHRRKIWRRLRFREPSRHQFARRSAAAGIAIGGGKKEIIEIEE